MDISSYAHERWNWKARNEDDVAIAYIRLALSQRDPEQTVQMLLPSVRAMVADVFRVQRLKVEEHVPWDTLLNGDTETSAETAATGGTGTKERTNYPHAGTRTRGQTDHPASTLDAINDLLKTSIWVWRTNRNGRPEGGMIAWAELTVEDIEPTIEHTRTIMAGHQRRIERLEKARALMAQHNVTVFGEIPFSAEVRELVTA